MSADRTGVRRAKMNVADLGGSAWDALRGVFPIHDAVLRRARA